MSYPPDHMDIEVDKNESELPKRHAGLPQIPEGHSESGRTSASVVARSQTKWEDWAEQNDVLLNYAVREDPELDAFMSGIKYPHHVKDEEIVKSLTSLENDKANSRRRRSIAETRKYADWVNALSGNKLAVDDSFQFKTWHQTLFFFWDSHSKANERSTNEYARRKGVDDLIELAFDTRSGAKHVYHPEEELALPSSPFIAKADAITTMDLPLDWTRFLQRLPNPHIFMFSINMTQAPSVATFLYEAKQLDKESSTRQLTLDFFSSQYQRRALGFEDGPIFGATLVGSIFTIYVSEWDQGRTYVNSTGYIFDLSSFPRFVECYFFLCKLAEYVSQEVEKVFERWKTGSGRKELEQKNRDASAKPWRQRNRSRRRSGNSQKQSRGGQGGAQDEWEARESPEQQQRYERDPEIVSMVSSIENRDPEPIGGYPLIMKRVIAHDIYCKRHPNATDTPVVKDIPGWARRSSDGRLDVI